MCRVAVILLGIISGSWCFGQPALPADSGSRTKTVERPCILKADLVAPFWARWQNGPDDDVQKSFGFAGAAEYLFKKRSSLQLTIFCYGNHWNDFWSPMDSYSIGRMGELWLFPEYKFYVSRKKRHSGYFIGGFVALGHGWYKEEYHVMGEWGTTNGVTTYYPPHVDNDSRPTNMIGAGISNGVQFYIRRRISLELLAGAGIAQWFYKDGTFKDIIPHLSANVGYRFELKPKSTAPDIPWD